MMHLTPDMIEAAYRYFCVTPPFRRWKLPDADDVEFLVSRDPSSRGHCRVSGETWEIAVSAASIGRTNSLMETVAHELVHLRCDMLGEKSHHGARFKKLAAQVCRCHGFDPKMF